MDRDQGCPRAMRMTTGRRVAWCVAVAALASAACGQLRRCSSRSGRDRSARSTIRTPATAGCWCANDEASWRSGTADAWPRPSETRLGAAGAAAEAGAACDPANEARLRPVIRAGDRLIVEEHTAVVDAALEAVRLNPAALGSTFKVRLKIGGKVLRAVALGPGRAALAAERGVRP